MSDPRWYALKIRGGYDISVRRPHEYRVRDELQSRGFDDIWLPECRIKKITRRRIVITDKCPLFPGYLFGRFPMDDDVQSQIVNIKNIEYILPKSKPHHPLAVNTDEFDRLKLLVESSGDILLIVDGRVKRGFQDTEPTAFRNGERIKVMEGPFEDQEGAYRSGDKPGQCKIELDIFGRLTLVDMLEALVRSVEEPV